MSTTDDSWRGVAEGAASAPLDMVALARVEAMDAGDEQVPNSVLIVSDAGGVCSSERSRMPTRLISSVRGIGVALRVSTSTLTFSFFIASFVGTVPFVLCNW